MHSRQRQRFLRCVWNRRTENNELNSDLTRCNKASVLSCPGLCSPDDLRWLVTVGSDTEDTGERERKQLEWSGGGNEKSSTDEKHPIKSGDDF